MAPALPLLPENGQTGDAMFVAITRFQPRKGSEQHALAAYGNLVAALNKGVEGFISCELLVSAVDPSLFLHISRWESEESYWASWDHPEAGQLYRHLEAHLEEDLTPLRYYQQAV